MNAKKETSKRNKEAAKSQGSTTKTMDIILIVVGTLLISFTIAMIIIYQRMGGVPDTLITCVFACCGCECGIMGWIKTTKTRYKEREWELEDRQKEEERKYDME